MKVERLTQICNYIETHKSASTLELTCALGVSEMTIRRDLSELEAEGKVLRYHGGAALRPDDKAEESFELRIGTNSSCKTAIGHSAVKYLTGQIYPRHPAAVFLGSGSTVYCMAKQIESMPPFPLITDNLYVSKALAASGNGTVVMLGGQLILPSLNVTGFLAEKNLLNFTLDCAFIGSSAIDEQGNLYAYNMAEAGMFSAVISAAGHVVVLADHSKLGRKNLVHIDLLNRHFTLITDSGAPDDCVTCYRESGAEVILAD